MREGMRVPATVYSRVVQPVTTGAILSVLVVLSHWYHGGAASAGEEVL